MFYRVSNGGSSETLLWSNPNGTSVIDFGAQTVTLSDDISNYDFIRLWWLYGYGGSSSILIKASEFLQMTGAVGTMSFVLYTRGSSSAYTRNVFCTGSRAVQFGACSIAHNNIPLKIWGVKILSYEYLT